MLSDAPTRARGRGSWRGSHNNTSSWRGGAQASASGRSSPANSDSGGRWERGGHSGSHVRGRGRGGERGTGERGRGRGRGLMPNLTWRKDAPVAQVVDVYDEQEEDVGMNDEEDFAEENELVEEAHANEAPEPQEPVLETLEEREQYWKQLVAEREIDRKRFIAEGKMDDPLVPKRLDQAINMVGTCMDMCPRFERYRRERENHLDKLEVIPGTKRVDHAKAVKIYERAAGDKVIPSDLRPPEVLSRTLDYLLHDVISEHGFSTAQAFVRDRSRGVRNDFTIQHNTGPIAIDVNERCARFHILSLHLEKDTKGFSMDMEDEQLMKTLQSLKEFYHDQRSQYSSPNELEMRIYHRLTHIRDQVERHDDIPTSIQNHPVFRITTQFRSHVQKISAPITKKSAFKMDAHGMEVFGNLVDELRKEGNQAMIYLVACILERHFGKGTIEDMESIRGDLTLAEIMDGGRQGQQHVEEVEHYQEDGEMQYGEEAYVEEQGEDGDDAEGFLSGDDAATQIDEENDSKEHTATPQPQPSPFGPSSSLSAFASPRPSPFLAPTSTSAFAPPASSPFASASSPFAPSGSGFSNSAGSGFTSSNPFATSGFSSSSFGAPKSSPFASAFAPSASTTNEQASSSPFAPPSKSTSSSPFAPVQPQATQPGTSEPAKSAFAPTTSSGTLNPKARIFAPPTTNSVPASTSVSTSSTSSIFSKPLTTNTFAPPSMNPFASSASPPTSTFVAPTPVAPPQAAPKLPSIVTTPKGVSQLRDSERPLPSPLTINTAVSGLRTFSPLATVINTAASELVVPHDTHAPGTPAPSEQPPAPKRPPLSLPSTPTASFSGSIPPPAMPSAGGSVKPAPTLLNFPKIGANGTALFKEGSSTGILSPLVPPSPSTSKNSFPFANHTSGPQRVPSFGHGVGLGLVGTGQSPLKNSVTASDLGEGALSEGEGEHLGASIGRRKEPVASTSQSPQEDARPVVDNGDHSPRTVKGKGIASKSDRQASVALAERFESVSLAVKTAFGTWVKNWRYREAKRKSVAYAERIRSEDASSSRRSSVTPQPSVERRWKRKRVSTGPGVAATDEEIAKRLRENHTEHLKRWTPGSFLDTIRERVGGLSAWPKAWEVWLSLNPKNDATAVWVEKKLSVPESGRWLSDTVFAILEKEGGVDEDEFASPGLVFFECTPLDGQDDIERKYRILDDCSRLREVIQSLPEERRYTPALFLVIWGNPATALPEDMQAMITQWTKEDILTSSSTLVIDDNTKDVDGKFKQSIHALTLDTTYERTVSLSFAELLEGFAAMTKAWSEPWKAKFDLSTMATSNWAIFRSLTQELIHFATTAVEDAAEIWGLAVSLGDVSPLDLSPVLDSDSAYHTILPWLEQRSLKDASSALRHQLRTARSSYDPFPTEIFVDALVPLLFSIITHAVGSSASAKRLIPADSVDGTKEDLEGMLRQARSELKLVPAVTPYTYSNGHGQAVSSVNGWSPAMKRRASNQHHAMDEDQPHEGSPSLSKRQRMDASLAELAAPATPERPPPPAEPQALTNSYSTSRAIPESPSPSASSSFTTEGDSTRAPMTAAMLRALAKNAKLQYTTPAATPVSTPAKTWRS